MAIKNITTDSDEMKGVIRFVKHMTKSMTFDENMESANWNKARRRNDLFYRLMPRQRGMVYVKKKLGNKGALLTSYPRCTGDCVVVYFHGGGFVTGNAFVTKGYSSMLAKYAKCMVYAVEYSLAPENPYPAGFEDCCKAFEEICKLHPGARISLVGESAGGCYCLAVAHKYKHMGRISSIIVHSPTVDFSGIVDHNQNENKDIIVKKGCLEPLKRMYVGAGDVTDPSVSPYYGDFTGFPPMYITCDANETLYADAVALYEKCVKADVAVDMVIATGAYHAFGVSGTNTPETEEILLENALMIRNA